MLKGLFSFFRYFTPKKKYRLAQFHQKEFSAAMKEKYRLLLKRDSTKDFDKEWDRTSRLERFIIDTHGFEGIKLILEDRNSSNFFALGTFPEDCPWNNLNTREIEVCIAEIFSPIKAKIPLLISALQERCEYLFAEKKDKDWQLHYFLRMKLYNGNDYYRDIIGGSPNPNSTPNANLQAYEWNIPKDLKEFYSIHDGFGEIYDANFILNSKEIKVMGEMMNPISENQGIKPKAYEFNDLLEFFPDGAGNAQCFLRTKEGNNSTVDWDHETWELSTNQSFYEFINEKMSEIDEE